MRICIAALNNSLAEMAMQSLHVDAGFLKCNCTASTGNSHGNLAMYL